MERDDVEGISGVEQYINQARHPDPSVRIQFLEELSAQKDFISDYKIPLDFANLVLMSEVSCPDGTKLSRFVNLRAGQRNFNAFVYRANWSGMNNKAVAVKAVRLKD